MLEWYSIRKSEHKIRIVTLAHISAKDITIHQIINTFWLRDFLNQTKKGSENASAKLYC